MAENDDIDVDAGELNFRIVYNNISPGTYYLKVEGYDDPFEGIFTTGPYDLHSDFSGGGGGNDTRATADDFDLNSTLSYTIDPVGDVDWLRIRITQAGTLRLWTTGNTDTVGTLTNAHGNVLAENDDIDVDAGEFNFRIVYDINSPGTYYLKVEGFDDAFEGIFTTGPYDLHSEFTPTSGLPRSTDPDDPNGWWTDAYTFPLNSMDEDWAISPSGDVDWLRIVVPRAGLLEVWTTGNTDTYAILTDSNRNILAEDDDSGTNLNFHVQDNVSSGTHYVAIQGFGTGRYTIHSKFTPGRVVSALDVNNDGAVDVDDLVLVATNFGKRNARGDINNDGIVDGVDILLVLAELEAQADNNANPPAKAPPHTARTSTAESLRQWIDRAKLHNNPDVEFQNGIAVLEQLLVTLLEQETIPPQTALLANYPNPFNPETWIPYHLSVPADVTLTIYAADGRVVRILEIGHQLPGVYKSRGRAAYWDGRNAYGEPVASGIYFYTLTAGDFAATRKMLIMK